MKSTSVERRELVVAAKCRPDRTVLSAIESSGIGAVELYTDELVLGHCVEAAELCRGYDLRYALHAPTHGYNPRAVRTLADEVKAERIVFHDIYFEDEWKEIAAIFDGCAGRVCVENTSSIHDPNKFMRRYGFGLCLDMEHLQFEIGGVFVEEFLPFVSRASHVHLTGYSFGTDRWHTHLHHSPQHSAWMLDLLCEGGYGGWVVSEARISLQSTEQFAGLAAFVGQWREGMIVGREQKGNVAAA